MALIKGRQTAETAQEAIVLDLGDLSLQAKRLRERAQAEADQILAAARDEAARLKAEAHEIGRAEGLERGLTEGRETGHAEGLERGLAERGEALQTLQARWTETIEYWESERRAMVLEARRDLLSLAVRMAEKIVHRLPEVDPTVVHEQVAAAIDHVSEPCHVTIRIHPEDRSLVERALPALVERLGGTERVTLREDADVERGGCDLRHRSGRVDATLETQLRRLVEALLPQGLSQDGGGA